MAEKEKIFPEREKRVVYGSGNKKTGKRTPPPREKKPRRTGGKRRLPLRRSAALTIAAVILILIYILVHKNGTAVFVAEETVGILEGRSYKAEQIIQTVEGQLESIVGTKVKLNQEITTKGVHISKKNQKDVCTMEHLLPKIRNLVTYKAEAAVVMVDNARAVVLPNSAKAEEVLRQVQTDLLPENGAPEDAKLSWVEDVQIVEELVESSELMEVDEAVSFLETKTEATQPYTIQTGDALYLIAIEFNTSIERLNELNPDSNLIQGIRAGQVITVPVQKPRISVKSIVTEEQISVEPKTTETRYDDSKPAGYQRVVQQGRAGQKKSVIQITSINGVVTEEQEISKEIITEPLPEIIVKGTQ
ncbi:MAG: LysM peptidoglycan-binding domain-containing protein [Anaerotignum sp.]|nr:LysM peptidoglycan-binding domain-containing protein [Anaerotignum sp.]